MEIYINDKTRNNQRYKNASQFDQQLQEIGKNHLIQDTIQRLNYVVSYFNVKNYRDLIEKIDLKIRLY